MEQEKLYVIEEKTYEAHIDEAVHLYGLLHQLAFLAEKIKDRQDMDNLIDTARRYGKITDQMFDRWSIPGRYLVFGDKAGLARRRPRNCASWIPSVWITRPMRTNPIPDRLTHVSLFSGIGGQNLAEEEASFVMVYPREWANSLFWRSLFHWFHRGISLYGSE